MSKNREPLAVKIAKKVLNDQLVLKKKYDSQIVFDESFWYAIDREIDNLKPETLGRIIAYGAQQCEATRASMSEGTDDSDELKFMSGIGFLKSGATNVIRAAMIDLIRENNERLLFALPYTVKEYARR